MEYNKIQNKLQDFVDFYSRSGADSIKWDEYGRLETVYKNNSLVQDLKDRASYLHTWMHNIGKEVYESDRSFNYTLVEKFSELDFLNQKYFDTSHSLTFTQEMFNELCVKYMEYQVERLTKQLLENSITSNSTCKMLNLVFEWNLECKQELIKIFKNLIEG
jgi:hypothetical protein